MNTAQTPTEETIPEMRERLKWIAQEQANSIECDKILRPEAYRRDPDPERYPINMQITEAQWPLVEEAFNLLKRQSEGYILRAENNPSETVKSYNTIQRHREKLIWINDLLSRFSENAF